MAFFADWFWFWTLENIPFDMCILYQLQVRTCGVWSWVKILTCSLSQILSSLCSFICDLILQDVFAGCVEYKFTCYFGWGGTGIPIPQELLKCVTILTPNDSEVAQLTGIPTNTWEQTIKATAKIQSWWLVLLLQDMEYLSYRNCIFVAIPYVCGCYGWCKGNHVSIGFKAW
jgi:hypothetical protein